MIDDVDVVEVCYHDGSNVVCPFTASDDADWLVWSRTGPQTVDCPEDVSPPPIEPIFGQNVAQFESLMADNCREVPADWTVPAADRVLFFRITDSSGPQSIQDAIGNGFCLWPWELQTSQKFEVYGVERTMAYPFLTGIDPTIDPCDDGNIAHAFSLGDACVHEDSATYVTTWLNEIDIWQRDWLTGGIDLFSWQLGRLDVNPVDGLSDDCGGGPGVQCPTPLLLADRNSDRGRYLLGRLWLRATGPNFSNPFDAPEPASAQATTLALAIDVGNRSRVECSAACEIAIAGKLLPGQNAYIGPANGSGLAADGVELFIGGINGSNGNLGATPKAATIGLTNTVVARMYAPNGTLLIKQGSNCAGRFIGRDVQVGLSVDATDQ